MLNGSRTGPDPTVSELPKVATKDSGERAWAIVLSGGEGERLRLLTERWLGYHRPKQYCTFVGTRSLLEHTWDRARLLVPPDRILTVIGRGHRSFLAGGRIVGKVLEQPRARGTAAGIFLAATYIRVMDPQATVLIFPSDHFVFPETRFVQQIREGGLLAGAFPDSLVLLGIPADDPEPEYGWIETGEARQVSLFGAGGKALTFWTVSGFREKPSVREAVEFFRRGYLWNSLVMAVRVDFLWRMGWHLLPEMMESFSQLDAGVRRLGAERAGPESERHLLERVYADMQPFNFSRQVLQRAVREILLLPVRGVLWSDWGRENRIVRCLDRIDRRPFFLDVARDLQGDSVAGGGRRDDEPVPGLCRDRALAGK